MSSCQRCEGAAIVFLCNRCTNEVRDTIAEMPWWLDRLTETALGQSRMSDNGGRRSAKRRDLDGDKELAACIEKLPEREADLQKARKARQKAALAHALATGGINARASELLASVADSLAYWVRVLCEARGVDYSPVRSPSTAHGSRYAAWLAVNVSAIAASEDAGEISGDIEGHLEDIVAMVNRPERMQMLGPCPTWDDKRDRPCGRRLTAKAEDVQVYCRACHVTHSTSRLLLARREEFERTPKTFEELVRYNRDLPAEFGVPLRTLQHWRQMETLRVRGWLRPDGHRGITRHGEDDQPLYLWADVRALVIAKPQRKATGAAAYRRVSGAVG